jgi:hypothetical protein
MNFLWSLFSREDVEPFRPRIVECGADSDTATAKDLAALQAELDVRRLPLRCRAFSPLAEPNRPREDQIEAYLRSLPESQQRAVKRKLFGRVQMITFRELERALRDCARALDEMLRGEDYSLGLVENKSQKWIAELALSFLGAPPKDIFAPCVPSSISGGESKQSPLTETCTNFVVFDDVAYSGEQVSALAEDFIEAVRKLSWRARNLYLVIPFTSAIARARLAREIRTQLQRNCQLTIHLVTSSTSVRSFAEAFPPGSPDRAELFAAEEALLAAGADLFSPVENYIWRASTKSVWPSRSGRCRTAFPCPEVCWRAGASATNSCSLPTSGLRISIPKRDRADAEVRQALPDATSRQPHALCFSQTRVVTMENRGRDFWFARLEGFVAPRIPKKRASGCFCIAAAAMSAAFASGWLRVVTHK